MTERMTELLETKTPIRGRLIRPTDAGYEDARQVWNGAIDRRPVLIVRCREGADAEWALRHARQNGLPVAIRGGGHNVAGSAVCDGGVVIDFTEMRGVEVDPPARSPGYSPARCGGTATRPLSPMA